jgi:hypothetical protein|tara:strand:+ start:36 stop:476 length:441 start_codon:yes stop_codon:yes gene_type:complete
MSQKRSRDERDEQEVSEDLQNIKRTLKRIKSSEQTFPNSKRKRNSLGLCDSETYRKRQKIDIAKIEGVKISECLQKLVGMYKRKKIESERCTQTLNNMMLMMSKLRSDNYTLQKQNYELQRSLQYERTRGEEPWMKPFHNFSYAQA